MEAVAPGVTGWEAGQRARIGILTKVFTAELVDAAIAKHERAEQRRRLLPARLVVYFVLALCLFARESYEEVLRVLTSGIPGSRALARVNRSSLCRARSRLGEDVLETLFQEVVGPLATSDTPGAWWRGLRLLALDGTQFDLPDSVSNGDTFDGPSTTGGLPFGFPQVRAVVLAEIGTHGILDARLGGYRDGERSLAYQLAGSTDSGDLVIADRGFWSVEFAHNFTATGADLLVRLQSNHLGTLQEELPDGSYLSMARPGKDVRLRARREGRTLPEHTIYRVITFTKDDKAAFLGTTLLDPEQYPAAELIALYRERWEIELASTRSRTTSAPADRSGPARRKASGRSCGPTLPSTTRSAGSLTPQPSPAPPSTLTASPTSSASASSAEAFRPSSEPPRPSSPALSSRPGRRHAAACSRPAGSGPAHGRSRSPTGGPC